MAVDLFRLVQNGCTARQLTLVTENGSDVNISNEDKESLLMFTMANSRAPGERKAELIRALLQRGADVNARNAKGQTTFMYACIMNQVKPLKVLLEQKDLNVNIQERDGNTGLMYACSIGNEQVVEVLLEAHHQKKINIIFDLMNSRGQTALDRAQSMHREKILNVFSKFSISSDSRFKPTFLKSKREPLSRTKKKDAGGRSKKSSVSSVLAGSDTEDELEDFGKLVRTMRECAAEVKQLCNDQNISYDKGIPKTPKFRKTNKTNRPKVENKTLSTPRIEIHPDSDGSTNEQKQSVKSANSSQSSQSVKKGNRKATSLNQTLSPKVPNLELPRREETPCETSVLQDSAMVSKSKRSQSSTRHSAKFRELSVDTMFSKGESVHLHDREISSANRSATSPAVLESAFRDPWSTFGDPLPGINNSPNSKSSLYLPPLNAAPGGENGRVRGKSGKANNADIWQLREGPPASREIQDR
ncbi:uncharacterized protein LOC134255820 [Saccostrea cucullata]|uniref:uncharacterized protein LOC134255820 n=1 Tax=Saccostrea cuccullata TaxID=36930 RepID=UPI002ED69A5C